MSQSTLDPNLAPEESTSEPSAARQGSATHRRRRAATRKTPSPRPEQATTAPAAEPTSAPEAEAPVSPPEATATTDIHGAATTPPETTEQPPARAAGRSRRRTPSGRKSNVQLVIPPTADGENVAEAVAAPDTQTLPADDVRAVPITSEPAEPATPLASEPTAPTEPAASSAEAPATPQRRYRFDRKATAAPYAPASRPERLSGALAASDAPEEAQPIPSPSGNFVEARFPPERSLLEREGGISVLGEKAELPPATPSAGEPEADAATNDAIDDIVSALGLRNAAPSREPLRLPVEAETPSTEETEAEGEAEEPSESESSAADTETAGTSRRRRRRRRGGSHAASAGEEDAEETLAPEPAAEPAPTPRARQSRRPAAASTPLPEPEQAGRNGYEQHAPPEYGTAYESSYAPYDQAERQPWDVSQGQAQIGQPESPFASPEPSVVRGFGPQPRGVAGPARETFSRTGRTERTDTPPISSNQLATMVTHAIQQQTDRLLNELRYHPQSPGMTVMLPAFPSTERVGVFVDVANLLYSSRNLRVAVDFGKLLEFLRGNRRIIRAHAYAPTNPDPRADQSFLDAVKGLGYRITTKNYKTFASGAKKADMDLDLCMDIVRMVDAGAVDTIVLVSGDSDFLPLLEYCSDHGVRVEVAAFEDAAAAILRQSCDLFINLSLVNDIRA